jgi:hypothetical protein
MTHPSYSRISDAIEVGWAGVPQNCDGVYASFDDQDRLVSACALGAANVALGYEACSFDYGQAFPQVREDLPEAIIQDLAARYTEVSSNTSLAEAIIILNDNMKVSKEELVSTLRGWGY